MVHKLAFGLILVSMLTVCSDDAEREVDVAVKKNVQVAQSGTSGDEAPVADDAAFEMAIGDVFAVSGGKIAVTGQVRSGSVSVGDSVCIGGGTPLTVEGIEVFSESVDTVKAGQSAGLLFRDLEKGDAAVGDLVRSCR